MFYVCIILVYIQYVYSNSWQQLVNDLHNCLVHVWTASDIGANQKGRQHSRSAAQQMLMLPEPWYVQPLVVCACVEPEPAMPPLLVCPYD